MSKQLKDSAKALELEVQEESKTKKPRASRTQRQQKVANEIPTRGKTTYEVPVRLEEDLYVEEVEETFTIQ